MSPKALRIGILGSGLMGGKLGTLFARAGHRVTFGYARTERKLARLAREAGHGARAGTPREAAEEADAVLLAVHWSRVSDVVKQAGGLAERVVLSCSLPMNAADTELVVGRTTSGAEQLAKRLRRSRIVSVFGTVPSEVLFDVYARRRRRPRPSLVVCGDDAHAKQVALRLAREIGFDPIDTGPLRIARFTEPFTLLVARLAYEVRGGPRLTYRFERQGRSTTGRGRKAG